MFKPTRIQQLVAIATLAAALPLAAQAQGKDPVRVALITSKSGGFATMGADVANGIRFAVEEANARGGVDGRRVIVAEGDDESTPDAGRRADPAGLVAGGCRTARLQGGRRAGR